MKATEVKKILKAAGIDTRKVSVQVTPSSYRVSLKTWSISLDVLPMAGSQGIPLALQLARFTPESGIIQPKRHLIP